MEAGIRVIRNGKMTWLDIYSHLKSMIFVGALNPDEREMLDILVKKHIARIEYDILGLGRIA